MKRIWTEWALWTASLVAVATCTHNLLQIVHQDAHISVPFVVPRLQTDNLPSDSLIEASDITRDGDLFRPDRQYHDPGENPGSLASAPPVAAQVRPTLVLRGIVGGPDWAAIVEGIPGTDGAIVLHSGRIIDGLSLRAVRRDTAILVGKDTIWTLAIRRVW